MRVPSAADLVGAWERGLVERPIQRALTLLSIAYPDDTRTALASLSIEERDRRLLAMHVELFGPDLNGCAECPRCGAQLEFAVDARELGQGQSQRGELQFRVDEGIVRFRLPTTEDLEALDGAAEVADLRRRLAERCILEYPSRDARNHPTVLADTIVDGMAAAMAVSQPHADAVIKVCCAECSHAWEIVLDIASFLWIEVNALAKRLLRQVAALAWAYGWREADVLAMSDARRAFYLEQVTA